MNGLICIESIPNLIFIKQISTLAGNETPSDLCMKPFFYYSHHRIETFAFCVSHWKHSELSSRSWTEVKLTLYCNFWAKLDDQVLMCLVLYHAWFFFFILFYKRLAMQLRLDDVEQWMSHRRLPEYLRRYNIFPFFSWIIILHTCTSF